MRVESANSGRPESPPAPVAFAVSRRLGRPTRRVADDHAVDAVAARDADDVVEIAERQIGRDLEQQRPARRAAGRALARIDHAREQVVERGRLLQVAQARRVGRRDVDGEIARHAARAPRSGAHSRRCGRRVSLLAPMLMPTMPARAGARARAAPRTASAPSLLKPSRLITASSASSRNRRGRGLPGCGSGVTVPTSTKPKPSRSSASGTSAFLSKPAAMPTGLGNVRPKACTRELRVVRRGARQRRELQRLERQRMRGLGIERAQQRPRQAVEQRDHGSSSGNTWPVGAERQRLHPEHRRERQRAIEMRKQCAAARGLLAQRGAERRRVDRDQHADRPRRRNAAPRSRRPARRWRNG